MSLPDIQSHLNCPHLYHTDMEFLEMPTFTLWANPVNAFPNQPEMHRWTEEMEGIPQEGFLLPTYPPATTIWCIASTLHRKGLVLLSRLTRPFTVTPTATGGNTSWPCLWGQTIPERPCSIESSINERTYPPHPKMGKPRVCWVGPLSYSVYQHPKILSLAGQLEVWFL